MDYRDPKEGDGDFVNWAKCAIDGCTNKCCLALDSIYCFPHTPGNKHVKHMKIDAANLTALDFDRPTQSIIDGAAQLRRLYK